MPKNFDMLEFTLVIWENVDNRKHFKILEKEVFYFYS